MIKLRNRHMPLISIALTVALLFTLGISGYFTINPATAEEETGSPVFSFNGEFMFPTEYLPLIEWAKNNPLDAASAGHMLLSGAALTDITTTISSLTAVLGENPALIPKLMSDPESLSMILNMLENFESQYNCCNGIELIKTGPDSASVGENITYTYQVKNNLPCNDLKDITIYDQTLQQTIVTIAKLEAGQTSEPATATHKVEVTDPNPLVNIATATGYIDFGPAYSSCGYLWPLKDNAQWSVNIVQPKGPQISVTKSADIAEAYNGDTINYGFTVKNTGDCILYEVNLYDDKLERFIDLNDSITETTVTLEPNQEVTAKASYTVSSQNDRGPFKNTAKAIGSYMAVDSQADSTPAVNSISQLLQDSGLLNIVTGNSASIYAGSVENEASATVLIKNRSSVDKRPGITVNKTADRARATTGETITYTYKIQNTGDYDFSKIKFVDDKLGEKTLGSLSAGKDMTLTDTYTVKATDKREDLKNTVTVTGYYNTNQQISDSDDATVTIYDPTYGGGGGDPTWVTAQPVTVAPEPTVAAIPQEVPEVIEVPIEPEVELPFTGGDALAYGLGGVVLICLGVAISKKRKAA